MRFKENKLPSNLEDRLRYLYRFQEVLRLFHNAEGQKYHNKEKTEKEFRNFQSGWFEDRNQLISREINNCKDQIPEIINDDKSNEGGTVLAQYKLSENDDTINININDIEED